MVFGKDQDRILTGWWSYEFDWAVGREFTLVLTREELIIALRDELILSGRWDIEDLPGDFEMNLSIEMALETNGWVLKKWKNKTCSTS